MKTQKKSQTALKTEPYLDEIRMIRWMCDTKITERFSSNELREGLGIDDIITVIQQHRLRWYGQVLRKDGNYWVKKCMDFEVEGEDLEAGQGKTWTEVIGKDCHTQQGRCYGP